MYKRTNYIQRGCFLEGKDMPNIYLVVKNGPTKNYEKNVMIKIQIYIPPLLNPVNSLILCSTLIYIYIYN